MIGNRSATQRQMEIGLGILRIVTGLVFAAHGYQKWFTMGIDGTTGFFTGLGIPLPGVAAILVATLELVGGLAFALDCSQGQSDSAGARRRRSDLLLSQGILRPEGR